MQLMLRELKLLLNAITMDDLKDYYNKYFSPSIAKFLIAGDVDQARVETALQDLTQKWQPKEVIIPEIKVPGLLKNQQYILLMSRVQNNLLLLLEHHRFQEPILIFILLCCQLQTGRFI